MAQNIIKEDLVQQQILEAAKKLFQIHGYHKVTMDDVARGVGKGRSSIYYYYKSKDEILDAVVEISIKAMIATIRKAVEQQTAVDQKLKAFGISKLTVLREVNSFYNTLDIGMDAEAMSHFNKMKIIHHERIMQLEAEILNKILSAGVKSGEIKPLSKKDKDTLVFVLLSCVHGLKREMRINDDFSQIESTIAMLSRTIMYGIKK